MVDSKQIVDGFKSIQDEICSGLESLDGKGVFREDNWDRSGGGGGRTRVIREGNFLEKGGVNFSYVHGELTDLMRREMGMKGEKWLATGVSIVLHPISPMVPIIHMNIRYFELDDGREWWFGGGVDLTPHYIDVEMTKKFHNGVKSICDSFTNTAYDTYKKWADDYFYLSHRDETRGVGGIFFDHLNENTGKNKDEIFEFVCNVGRNFVPLYKEQVEATRNKGYGELEKQWQLIRRGRYVEFNLVWDRGTKFGLVSNGRTESILMSLPITAGWEYQFDPSDDPEAQKTLSLLKRDINWVDFDCESEGT
ncbi:oxygen-dependent coproporphyrinogen oxidase [Membranihabitans maritimus]|uniref:oxygen-dependent coproporphyrinogen oxidase n=1 Tax=Membranihabitans maritimus TaxID=2904244 RepID=UPI001F00D72E|nr:oxygen-dependent coproporphyrinogen oxidase [Membranihabitans maritimus]